MPKTRIAEQAERARLSRMNVAELAQELSQYQGVAESYSAMANAILAQEDEGWQFLNSTLKEKGEDGFTLQQIKEISQKARQEVAASSLLKRAVAMRSSNVFSGGFTVKTEAEKLPPRIQKIIDDEYNRKVMNSFDAWARNERTLFHTGNFFVLYDRVTKEFQRIPISQIQDAITAPANTEKVYYYQRKYTSTNNIGNPEAKSDEITEWIPVDTYKLPAGVTELGAPGKKIKIRRDQVIIDLQVNVDEGNIWGVPDVLPALPWAAMYREYVKDSSRVLKALAMIAWVVKTKTTKGVANVGAKVATADGTAKVATITQDMDISAMPRNNTVDINTGRPIAALVASACEVSVVALLSDPGVSGAAATAKTLDGPTEAAAMARQQLWGDFIKRLYRVMGVTGDIRVEFPSIAIDPEYRQVESYTKLWDSGLFHDDEIRAELAKLLNLELRHDNAPDGVMTPNNENFPDTLSNDKQAAGSTTGSTASTGQGKSGKGPVKGNKTASGDNSGRDSASRQL